MGKHGLSEFITNILSNSKNPVSYTYIKNEANKMGYSDGQVAGKVRVLHSHNIITKVKRGYYILNTGNTKENLIRDFVDLVDAYNLTPQQITGDVSEFYNVYNKFLKLKQGVGENE